MTKQTIMIMKQLALMSFLTALVAMPQGSGGYVLCKGEDGHVEIELASQGSCFTCVTEDGHGALAQASSIEKNHCGGCVDVVLSSTSFEGIRKCSGAGQAIFAPTSITGPKYLEILTARLLSQPPPISSPALVRIKTVRLLI